MSRAAFVLAALLAGFGAVSPAGAEVLGRRSIGIALGATLVDDVPIDRASLDFGAAMRLPVGTHVDIYAFHEQAMLEGRDRGVEGAPYVKTKNSAYGVGVTAHFLPARTVNPYLSCGLANTMTATTVDGKPTAADEHLVVRFGGGAEINLHRRVSVLLGAAYNDAFDGSIANDLSANLSVHAWATELLLVGLGVRGSFETGDLSAEVTIAYGF